jgi:hypothetical protein
MEKVIIRILCLGFFLTATVALSQSTLEYSGTITYHDDMPLSDVTVQLSNLSGEEMYSAISDNSGYFVMPSVLEGTYIVSYSTDQPAGGVELADAYLLEEYLDGDTTLDEIQKLAADVNGNHVINNGDRQMILNYLNKDNPFPVGPWVFTSDTITLEASRSLTGDIKLGSSSGDVNGSLQPDPKRNHLLIENPVICLDHKASAPITFTLSSSESLNITGMHMVFRIPDELRIVHVESALPGIYAHLNNNILKVTWMDTTLTASSISSQLPLLTITTEEKSDSYADAIYHLVLTEDSHLVDASGNLLSGISLTLPDVSVIESKEISQKAYPNPFRNVFTLEYYLPADGTVTTMITDQCGRTVYLSEDVKNSGVQLEKFDGSGFAPGAYYYTIHYGNDNQSNIRGTIFKSK